MEDFVLCSHEQQSAPSISSTAFFSEGVPILDVSSSGEKDKEKDPIKEKGGEENQERKDESIPKKAGKFNLHKGVDGKWLDMVYFSSFLLKHHKNI